MNIINLNDADVIVIQKQTALERYTSRIMNIDFLDYLSQDNQSKDELNQSHHAHVHSRKVLMKALNKLHLKYVVLNLDELKENRLHFFHENDSNSTLQPKKKLVISLGGDGTLLHASHHVGDDVRLLGMNSSPNTSVGHLCLARSENIESILKEVIVDNKEFIQPLKRIRVQINGHKNIPLALNDVLISNLHPAATSRYQISVINNQTNNHHAETHLSSGLWLATAAGRTAAISSYQFEEQKLDSDNLMIAVREPYARCGESLQLKRFVLDGKCQRVSIFSRMRQGLVCLDGPDFSIQFGFGEVIDISVPQKGALKLIYK